MPFPFDNQRTIGLFGNQIGIGGSELPPFIPEQNPQVEIPGDKTWEELWEDFLFNQGLGDLFEDLQQEQWDKLMNEFILSHWSNYQLISEKPEPIGGGVELPSRTNKHHPSHGTGNPYKLKYYREELTEKQRDDYFKNLRDGFIRRFIENLKKCAELGPVNIQPDKECLDSLGYNKLWKLGFGINSAEDLVEFKNQLLNERRITPDEIAVGFGLLIAGMALGHIPLLSEVLKVAGGMEIFEKSRLFLESLIAPDLLEEMNWEDYQCLKPIFERYARLAWNICTANAVTKWMRKNHRTDFYCISDNKKYAEILRSAMKEMEELPSVTSPCLDRVGGRIRKKRGGGNTVQPE